MFNALIFFALAFALSFFIAVFSSPALIIFASPSETNLKVLEIENQSNLPVEFFDSLRSDDDFVFYEFKLSSKKPLLLRKLDIMDEGKADKKEFSISPSKSGAAIINLLEDSITGASGALIDGSNSLLTSETFKHDYSIKEGFLSAELADSYFLNAIYDFEEGNVKVKYFFSDKETRAFWLFFWLILISTSAVLTTLCVLAVRLRQNETVRNL
jgi:hypothetical protein